MVIDAIKSSANNMEGKNMKSKALTHIVPSTKTSDILKNLYRLYEVRGDSVQLAPPIFSTNEEERISILRCLILLSLSLLIGLLNYFSPPRRSTLGVSKGLFTWTRDIEIIKIKQEK